MRIDLRPERPSNPALEGGAKPDRTAAAIPTILVTVLPYARTD